VGGRVPREPTEGRYGENGAGIILGGYWKVWGYPYPGGICGAADIYEYGTRWPGEKMSLP